MVVFCAKITMCKSLFDNICANYTNQRGESDEKEDFISFLNGGGINVPFCCFCFCREYYYKA